MAVNKGPQVVPKAYPPKMAMKTAGVKTKGLIIHKPMKVIGLRIAPSARHDSRVLSQTVVQKAKATKKAAMTMATSIRMTVRICLA